MLLQSVYFIYSELCTLSFLVPLSAKTLSTKSIKIRLSPNSFKKISFLFVFFFSSENEILKPFVNVKGLN